MWDFLQKLFRPRVSYQPLIEVRIFRDAILHNLNTFKENYPKFKFAPVLKSNAYGHGLVEVAEILDKQNCPFFMVDSFYEALVLRRAFIKTKILILGFVRTKEILENKLRNVSYGIIDLQILKDLSASANRQINVHLKIDTGMHRQGVLIEQIDEAIKLIRANKNIILEGVCSHLADSDGKEAQFTEGQIKIWNGIVARFKKEFPDVKYFHLSNTAGAEYQNQIDANVSRLGIGLYGFNSSPVQKLNLKPSLEMVSIVTSIKKIPAGEKVGYNVTFTAEHNMVVATVPVGYNEGVDRRFSNKGFFKIKNIFCPIVGRVSMNMCSADVTNVKGLQLQNEVQIISNNPNDKNSVENIAKISGQILHEVLVKIPAQLKRVVV